VQVFHGVEIPLEIGESFLAHGDNDNIKIYPDRESLDFLLDKVD
jgi:hypothetical protein